MEHIVKALDSEILHCIQNAKSISVAAALTNSYGVDLLSNASKTCFVRVVVGVNLPTPVDVLCSLRNKYKNNARIWMDKAFFHPKVYLFVLKDGTKIGYIGSGNFTSGGMKENIEMAYKVTAPSECDELQKWFDDIFDKSSEISDTFINNYRPYVNKWSGRNAEQDQDFSNISNEMASISLNKKAVLRELKKFRDMDKYQNIIKDSAKSVSEIRKSIDYDNDFKNFNLEKFLSYWELGHIIPIYKNQIEKAVKEGAMRKLCKMLCDDSIDIEERFRLAFSEYKIYGCGDNIITKILCVHNPKAYMLLNNVSKDYLKYTKISFVRGTSPGARYKQICITFKALCSETEIKDFAVLDDLLYRAMNELNK